MQQKTDGRVVRLLTKHLGAEDRALEQWFHSSLGSRIDMSMASITETARTPAGTTAAAEAAASAVANKKRCSRLTFARTDAEAAEPLF
jgi:hypothetical protein